MKRQPVTFKVKTTADDGAPRWLTPEAELVEDEMAAAVFTFRRSPTGLDSRKIRDKTHEYAGGLSEFAEVQSAAEGARLLVLDAVEATLWPDGRPDAEGQARTAQLTAIDAAWDAHRSADKTAWVELSDQVEEWRWWARWAVLAEDVPEGWEEIALVPLEPAIRMVIWNAWMTAHREDTAGKARSSGA